MTQLLTRTRPSMTDVLSRIAPAALIDGDAYGKLSSKYAKFSTVPLVKAMERSGLELLRVKQTRTRVAERQPFVKHQLTFTVPQTPGIARKLGDSIPLIQLINSHDGTSAIEVRRSIERLVCLNGMTRGSVSDFHKYPHRGNGHSIDEIIGDIFGLIESFGDLTSSVQAMQAKVLEPWQQSALAAQAANLRWGDKAPVSPAQLLTARRYADQGSDVWSVFNRIQENIIKGGQGYVADRGEDRPARRGTTRAVKSIDADLKINGGLWTLAEALVA